MAKCSYCGASESMPFTCKFCGSRFCAEHRLPESHECPGLVVYKESRGKEPEKWIYEPFKAEYKHLAGREPERGIADRVREFFSTLDARKVLYILVVLIVLSVLLRSLGVL
ncbi:AN1-type zinc finger domain-containing protein [Candidatus Pyrohabitans sp.]